MKRCSACNGSGRVYFRTQEIPVLDLPPGCSVILDNCEVLDIHEYLDPERQMEVDGLTARVIAFELPCPDCDGQGFREK